MKKSWVWLVILFTVLVAILYIVRSRETFSGPCQYSAAMPNTFIGGCSRGCQTFPNLADAQTACSAELTCGGVTQTGERVFELRAGPGTGPSPSGETSYLCSTPIPVVAPPIPSPPSAPPFLGPPVAPASSATPMDGTPAPVFPLQAPPTVVLPYNTPPGTYLLRQVT